MIDLYTWHSPNGRKISIMLEECELPYRVVPVDLTQGQQKSPEFAAINLNRRIPAIVDRADADASVALAESGAILIYLGERTGRLLSRKSAVRANTLQWLLFQASHVGPTLGQAEYFISRAPERVPAAIQHYMLESMRVLNVLNDALSETTFLAGEYSIADIATFPWIDAAWEPLYSLVPEQAESLTSLRRWWKEVAARPAVQKGMAVPESPKS